jgi:hypothetical protein
MQSKANRLDLSAQTPLGNIFQVSGKFYSGEIVEIYTAPSGLDRPVNFFRFPDEMQSKANRLDLSAQTPLGNIFQVSENFCSGEIVELYTAPS